ncbi:ABC transporter permease [Streptomyces sioyaensis]|uniref:ABC transporter permease n=1 Tax=Streptomyces sioyaensis TaxID=67364 RepID=UPI0037D57418
MSTTTPTSAPSRPKPRPVYKLTARRVLRSEWAKLWSLRSTWITLGVALLVLVAFGMIAAATYSPSSGTTGMGGPPGSETGSQDAIGIALTGGKFAQLALGVLGVLITAGEYSTGMIRSTLTAVPKRLPVLWSKVITFGVVALVVGTVGSISAFLSGTGFLHGETISLTLSSNGVLRSLLGAGVFFALVGVLGVALGALFRSVAGGISVLVAGLLLLPALTDLLPSSLKDDISPYLPGNAGGSIYALHQAGDTLSPGAGLAVFAGWTVLTVVGAAYRLARTDA